MAIDLLQFLTSFQDYLAPKLDTYEQALYLYMFRHSRLLEIEEAVIGFKSARRKMALGVGEKGKPMSEGVCYSKLRSLQAKGCVELKGTERNGTRIVLKLPHEIPNVVPSPKADKPLGLEEMDFFDVAENRPLILQREGYKCFYCLRTINTDNYVLEHVQSRPEGLNDYRNVVAACRQCNNRKGSTSADDFLRTLYRDGFLNDAEFEARLSHLSRLRTGELKPIIDQSPTNTQ